MNICFISGGACRSAKTGGFVIFGWMNCIAANATHANNTNHANADKSRDLIGILFASSPEAMSLLSAFLVTSSILLPAVSAATFQNLAPAPAWDI